MGAGGGIEGVVAEIVVNSIHCAIYRVSVAFGVEAGGSSDGWSDECKCIAVHCCKSEDGGYHLHVHFCFC